jgi:hypothetical protein
LFIRPLERIHRAARELSGESPVLRHGRRGRSSISLHEGDQRALEPNRLQQQLSGAGYVAVTQSEISALKATSTSVRGLRCNPATVGRHRKTISAALGVLSTRASKDYRGGRRNVGVSPSPCVLLIGDRHSMFGSWATDRLSGRSHELFPDTRQFFAPLSDA